MAILLTETYRLYAPYYGFEFPAWEKCFSRTSATILDLLTRSSSARFLIHSRSSRLKYTVIDPPFIVSFVFKVNEGRFRASRGIMEKAE